VDEGSDAKVAGTIYNAPADVAGGGFRSRKRGMCKAGVIRNKDGSASVTITYPGSDDSGTIFFDKSGTAFSADVAEADGSARHRLVVQRKGEDIIIITLGLERYEIVDAFVHGG
jgi:hypothetical protein